VGYGKINGQNLVSGALGESNTFFNQYTYAAIRSALISSAATGANALPATDPTGGGNYWVTTAEAKAIGLSGPSSATEGSLGQSAIWLMHGTQAESQPQGGYGFGGVGSRSREPAIRRSGSLFVRAS